MVQQLGENLYTWDFLSEEYLDFLKQWRCIETNINLFQHKNSYRPREGELPQLLFLSVLLLFSTSHTEVTGFWSLVFQNVFRFFVLFFFFLAAKNISSWLEGRCTEIWFVEFIHSINVGFFGLISFFSYRTEQPRSYSSFHVLISLCFMHTACISKTH